MHLRALNSAALRRFHFLPIFTLVLCSVLLSWPLWWLGFPPLTDDAKCHVAWHAQFSLQFLAGDWYPRWLSGMNAGLGSPAFFYYPPLASWLTAILSFFASDNDAWRVVGFSASVALVAAGCTMYAWLQTSVSRRWAVIGAALYCVTPYRNTTDIYLRGAFGEHWAFVWLPLVFWATQSLVSSPEHCPTSTGRQRLRAWCALSLWFSLLLLTHPPTGVIVAPVVVMFVMLTSSTRCWVNALLSSTALGFAAMLTAFYLLPALKMEDLVWRDEMRVGEFSYQTAFLTLDKAVGGLRLQAISLITILVVAACCFFAARTVKNAVSADENAPQFQVLWKRIRVWFALAVFAAFMTTPFSAPLYALILPLQRIQFPYRWLVVVSFALSPLVAATLELCTMLRAQSRNEYSMRKKWSLRIAAAAASLMVLSWIPLQAFYIRKAYPQFLPNADFARYVQWYVENGAEMPEHRSRDAQTLKTDASALYRSLGLQSRGYNFAEIVRGQGSVRVVERSPRRIELEISSLDAQNLSVRVRQFNFGAWRAVSNSNVLPISSSVPDGLVLIEVPANTSRVTLEMPPTSSEKWGKNLSLAALTMWMILLSSTWIQRHKP